MYEKNSWTVAYKKQNESVIEMKFQIESGIKCSKTKYIPIMYCKTSSQVKNFLIVYPVIAGLSNVLVTE